MQHLIQLLPDAIANQIAAGEVVQRPASVIKELLENAIDAGATKVEVELKNAGKTLIRVSDNGCGMSAQDARMCFERHATSKIKNQKDLFAIRTLGFRGEALASIAAVAQVRLRTRLHDAELGTETQIEASTFEAQQAVVCPPGTMFEVKNLFFNVPARRNFLKSNPVETRHILNEFVRISLAHPEVQLCLTHNDTSVYQLSQTAQEERIAQLFGTELRGNLREIEETTGYVRIGGFMGLPEIYRKNRSEQFFFVNGRYIRSNYLNHAVYTAFEAFLPRDRYPFYVIFLEIDPVHVDINIHPTKTEVKFDDEQTIYALLHSVVKRALGTIENAPEFDFTDADLKAAIYGSQPARSPGAEPSIGKKQSFQLPRQKTVSPKDWDHLYKGETRPAKVNPETARKQEDLFGQKAQAKAEHVKEDTLLVQHQLRYIITQKGPDLLVIDQHLAHQRILYESFLRSREGGKLASQQLLFPQTMEFPAADYQLLMTAVDIFAKLGFEVKEFGKNTLIVYGVPTEIATSKVKSIFAQILDDLKQMGQSKVESRIFEGIAKAVSYRSAVTSPHKLSSIEMKNMVNALFRCEAPGFAPNGRPTFKVLSMQELEQFFR